MLHFILVMKKAVIIVISGVLLGLLGAGGYLWYMIRQEKSADLKNIEKPAEKILIEYATWKDPLGITFSYPVDATIDKHDEDKENYMHVEITSATHSGGLVLWAKDLPKGVTDLLSWAKKEIATGSGVIIDTTLGKVDAKKILFGTDKVRIGVVYDGLVFEIEGNLDTGGYWKDVLETTISSYIFYPIEGSGQASPPSDVSGDTGVSVDEEEVLE